MSEHCLSRLVQESILSLWEIQGLGCSLLSENLGRPDVLLHSYSSGFHFYLGSELIRNHLFKNWNTRIAAARKEAKLIEKKEQVERR